MYQNIPLAITNKNWIYQVNSQNRNGLTNLVVKENDTQSGLNQSAQEIFENLNQNLDISNSLNCSFWVKIISDETDIFGGLLRISSIFSNHQIGIDSSQTTQILLSTNNDIQNVTVNLQVNKWNFFSISLDIFESFQKLQIYINSELQADIENSNQLEPLSLFDSKIVFGSSGIFSQTKNWR
jgi:hypothetical protein